MKWPATPIQANQALDLNKSLICQECWPYLGVARPVSESFFATIKKELIHRYKYATRREAVTGIFEYIELLYNRVRKHSQLGYTSPAEFRRNNQSAAAAA